MLHWFYTFNYLLICCFISLIFLNRSFLSIILLGEFLLVILFSLGLFIGGFYNIYYASAFGFILLVFGGLELALNILIYLM